MSQLETDNLPIDETDILPEIDELDDVDLDDMLKDLQQD
ncbi:hypothetical protein AM1_B0081 (plasmid) [Acaryochloris marina MBIC11017]|uniref:Uncharacterized protein n=1 Tax=Acaryochloris marina (strain MBIC 11017) TaxID=329726 RepID=A8ZM38_ACAM1|nr:hypothetical protein AM1_B0081 [Acaryochloris marina MBIC11017]